MFCRNCGAKLNGDAHFCSCCGNQSPSPAISFPDKVRTIAKKAGSSPLFLIVAICFTLVQALDILSFLLPGNTLAFGDLFANLGIEDPTLLSSLENYAPVAGLIGMLPTLVIILSLWLIYGCCASRKPNVNTAGLTMIFVVTLIQLVLTCLILLAAALFAIVFVLESTEVYVAIPEALPLKTLLSIFLGLHLTIFAFVLIWHIKICTTVSNVRSTLKTGVPNKRVSRFVGVMCYISGIVNIFIGISNFLSAGLNGFYTDVLSISPSSYLLSGISNLLAATALILLGILIFSYRSKMKDLEAEDRMNTFKTLSYAAPYTAPVYVPPQPAPEPVCEPEVPVFIEEPELPKEPVQDENN